MATASRSKKAKISRTVTLLDPGMLRISRKDRTENENVCDINNTYKISKGEIPLVQFW